MNNIVTPQDSGISQAWLMATMGMSKPACRRILKRELNDISIPDVCEEVSNIAAESRHLRLTSNLLYGLSLIYKQKVAYMESDLTLICDRLTTPLFTRKVFSEIPIKKRGEYTVGRGVSYKIDDQRFDMNADFILDFPDSESEYNDQNKPVQNASTIKGQDQITRGYTEASEIPGHVIADAQDKLFLEYMNKSIIAKDILLEECLNVDFEFNQDGEIIGHGEPPNEIPANKLFLDLNLEEDFNVVSQSIEDISKTGNHTCNEQNPINLNHSKAMISQAPVLKPHKRRKLRPIFDEVITTNIASSTKETSPPSIISLHSVSAVFHELSLIQPPFLNMCYRMIYGVSNTSSMSTLHFPLSSRHPNVSNLDSFLKEIDDIERGRNLSSRRPSLSLFDDVVNGSPFPITGEEPLERNAFDLEPLSPMLDDIEETDSGEYSNDVSRRLESFKEFLAERAKHVAEQQMESVEDVAFTLELLIPSRPSFGEQSVPRCLAANAISCLLQLACSGEVVLLTKETNEYLLCKPTEIYIAFY